MTRTIHSSPRRQRGIALIAVLVILLIVTLLAVSASRNASQGEMLARTSRAQQIALQAAEAALADARADLGIIKGAVTTGERNNVMKAGNMTSCTEQKGICPFNPYQSQWEALGNDDWAARGEFAFPDGTNKAAALAAPGSVAGVAKQPKYLVEVFGGDVSSPDVVQKPQFRTYRITALGYGPTADTTVTLQEAVQRKNDADSYN